MRRLLLDRRPSPPRRPVFCARLYWPMSNQAYTNQDVPYWLARPGVDAVSFVKQAAPPLAWLNRGILYELTDGVLYYNGSPIATGGGDPVFDSVTLTPVAANPGGPNTLWEKSPGGHLWHGAHDTENYDMTQVYVNPAGLTLLTGGTGAINSPLSTISEALTLWTAGGLTVTTCGDLTADAFTLPAQAIVAAVGGPSFRTLLGAITCAGPSWAGPPPFGRNQSNIVGCVAIGPISYDASLMNIPQLVLTRCAIAGGITALDTDCDSILLATACIIESAISVTDMQAQFLDCAWSVIGLGGSLSLTHTAAVDMGVLVSNLASAPAGAINIAANSLANVLTVDLVGLCQFSSINVNSVAALGGLILNIDDATAITWAPGTQALTTVNMIKAASLVGYSPAVPGDWLVPPVIVSDALDQLAATGTGDVVGPAGSTDRAVALFSGASGKIIQNSSVTIDGVGEISGVKGVDFVPQTGNFLPFFTSNRRAGTVLAANMTGPWGVPPPLPWTIERAGNLVVMSIGPSIGADTGAPAAITYDFDLSGTLVGFQPQPGFPQNGTVVIRSSGVDSVVSWVMFNGAGFVLQISSSLACPPADALAPFPATGLAQTGFPNAVSISWLIATS